MYSLSPCREKKKKKKKENIQSDRTKSTGEEKRKLIVHGQGHSMIFRSLIVPPRLCHCEPVGKSLHSENEFMYHVSIN